MTAMLTVEDLEVRYGTIPALTHLGFEVAKGSLTALLGANGAGKSTTLNTVAGLLRPKRGRVIFDGRDVTGREAHRITRQGLALVPEGRLVVAPLSVMENLRLSAFARGRSRKAQLDEVWDLFPRLAERKTQTAGLMSGGEQQMLAIARAWMTRPSMVLLDEPSMGLSPALVDIVFDAIQRIHQAGATVLLVEQNASRALPVCDHAYLIHRGDIVASGSPQELEADPEMVARHLGLDPKIAVPEFEEAVARAESA